MGDHISILHFLGGGRLGTKRYMALHGGRDVKLSICSVTYELNVLIRSREVMKLMKLSLLQLELA